MAVGDPDVDGASGVGAPDSDGMADVEAAQADMSIDPEGVAEANASDSFADNLAVIGSLFGPIGMVMGLAQLGSMAANAAAAMGVSVESPSEVDTSGMGGADKRQQAQKQKDARRAAAGAKAREGEAAKGDVLGANPAAPVKQQSTEARTAQRQAASLRRGRLPTILTGSQGITALGSRTRFALAGSKPVGGKTALGA